MEWISVNDKLPEKGQNVLGFDGKCRHIASYIPKHYLEFECDEDDAVGMSDYVKEKDMAYWKEGWYSDEEQFGGYYDSFFVIRKITHWMPLPEPPKQ